MGRHSSRSRERRRRSSSPRRGDRRERTTYHPVTPKLPPHDAVDPNAPRLPVPTLPVEVSAFIDFFASFVVVGGPLFEAEVKMREAQNHYFSFLNASWNDPIQVYYRWRVYSLLQEDNKLQQWRTAPFQLQVGSEACVWLPPPRIPCGPEAATTEKAARVPSARWIGLELAEKKIFFAMLKRSEVQHWQTLLSYRDGTSSLAPRLLSRGLIEQRLLFVVDYSAAAYHVAAILLDEIIDCSYASSEDLVLRVSAMLSYLMTVADVFHNATSSDEEAYISSQKAILRAFEMILPSTIEATLRLASQFSNVPSHSSADTAVARLEAPTQSPQASALGLVLWVRCLLKHWTATAIPSSRRSLLHYEFLMRPDNEVSVKLNPSGGSRNY